MPCHKIRQRTSQKFLEPINHQISVELELSTSSRRNSQKFELFQTKFMKKGGGGGDEGGQSGDQDPTDEQPRSRTQLRTTQRGKGKTALKKEKTENRWQGQKLTGNAQN